MNLLWKQEQLYWARTTVHVARRLEGQCLLHFKEERNK